MSDLTELDLLLGQESYIRYATGVAIIGNPESHIGIHSREVEPEFKEDIALCAEKLMFEGLKQVIRYSHDEENRSYLAELEHRFTEAIPNIREIVDMAYDENGDRLAQINPSLPLLKPAPIYDPIVYRYICHSRLEKITTERLLDGFNPSPFFGNLFQNRTLNSLSPKLRSVPKIA